MTRGGPLAEQLRQGDKHVTVEINASYGTTQYPPDRTSWVRYWADLSDFIVVFRVESIRSNLVYRGDIAATEEFSTESISAPEERANWIVSTVRGRLERVVKGTPVLKEGDELVFLEDGGSATVRGVKVDARLPWQQPMVEGRRYLWFGSLRSAAHGWLRRIAVYEEPAPGGLLVDAQRRGDPGIPDPYTQLTLEPAVAYIESRLHP
jgi:hypothetical protein